MRGSGVAVVTVCPGYIATPMTAQNPYRMPFLMAPDVAARKIARAIAARKRFYVLPWQMAIAGRALRMLPRPLYDRVFANAPRQAAPARLTRPRAQLAGTRGSERNAHADGHAVAVAVARAPTSPSR